MSPNTFKIHLTDSYFISNKLLCSPIPDNPVTRTESLLLDETQSVYHRPKPRLDSSGNVSANLEEEPSNNKEITKPICNDLQITANFTNRSVDLHASLENKNQGTQPVNLPQKSTFGIQSIISRSSVDSQKFDANSPRENDDIVA